jgi:hypothetical protein
VDHDGTIMLVTAILRGTPSLPGAACRGEHELYDDVPGQSHRSHMLRRENFAASLILCRGCPVRPACPAASVAA